jgi:divalent metal cation (Fe/Co/Zn/Cd) transporter
VGKARLEPIGVLVFSVIMIVSFMQVGVESVRKLLEEAETHMIVVLSLQSILIMASTGITFFSRSLIDFCDCEIWLLVVVEVN